MPLYRYVCTAEKPHTFEQRGGFDDDEVKCIEVLFPIGRTLITCGEPAMRQATYPGQGIIIK